MALARQRNSLLVTAGVRIHKNQCMSLRAFGPRNPMKMGKRCQGKRWGKRVSALPPPGHTTSGAVRTGECNHEMPGLPYPAFRRVNGERGDGSPRRLPLRRNTHASLTDRMTRTEMGDSALCWFNPPSAPPAYRSDQTVPSEFPICQVDKPDREPDLMSREGN
jgi:hypothetical protein